MTGRSLTLALGLAALPAAEAQTLFKCVGPDGKVSYQSEKCAQAARESTVRPPDPPAARAVPDDAPAPKAAAPETRGSPQEPPVDWNAFVAQISGYENCVALVPGFGVKHGPDFQRWKERHRSAYARFSQDGEAQRKVRESTAYVRGKMNARSAEERQYDTDNCENTVAAAFAPPTTPAKPPAKN